MSQTSRRIALFFCFTLFLVVLSNLAQGQTETVLSALGGALGVYPTAGITFDQQGRIYGTTTNGGAHSGGVVYRLEHAGGSWVASALYSFGQAQDGSNPYGGVAFGPDGLLYGTTTNGGAFGYGTVFRLQPPPTVCHAVQCPWLESILYSFTGGTDGAYPEYEKLAFDRSGNIYGTTYSGGSSGEGVVFKLARSGNGWAESGIYSFTGGGSGASPLTGVIFDTTGNLYGGTLNTVYELSPTQSGWIETTLYSNDGGGGLVWGHGDLFVLSGAGPLGGSAVAYELAPQSGSWTFTQLQNFGDQNFGPAAPPTFDAQGNLYGPLPSYNGGGEIFKLTRSGNQWIYSPYYQFTGGSGGSEPVGAVTFDTNGNMYGTTLAQGGLVWEITP
jgi:uncharacterized repeat protein (TIGR03803 family)